MKPSDNIKRHSIIFLHPLGGSARIWQYVIEHLTAFDCHALDLPGFGENTDCDNYNCEEMARHIVRKIATVQPDSYTIVGHSMGGKIATIVAHMAETGSSHLSGLTNVVLVAASPPSPEPMSDTTRSQMLSWAQGVDTFSNDIATTFIADNIASNLPADRVIEMMSAVIQSKPEAWSAWLKTGSQEDWSGSVGVLQTRCLIIAGAEDGPLGVEGQKDFNAPIYANSKLNVVENAAHLIPLEQPAKLARLIKDFIAPTSDWADPPDEYTDLLGSHRTSARTRAVHLSRREIPNGSRLDSDQRALLSILCDLILPQPSGMNLDLVSRIEAAIGQSDGWRFVDLPPDDLAFEMGLKHLDALAHDIGDSTFCRLRSVQQTALLDQILNNDPVLADIKKFNMRLWFEDLRAMVVTAYMSHPAAMVRVGYDGFANGGDGIRLTGYKETKADHVESWALPSNAGEAK